MADRNQPGSQPVTIALIGFMAAGKTTVGRELDPAAVDSDREIERRAGRSVESIFAEQGEAGFRRLEEEVVLELLTQAPRPLESEAAGDSIGRVISLGGGSVLSPAIREALSDCLTVWLDIDVETAWRRSGSGEGERPLARDRVAFEALYKKRREIYRELADAVLPAAALAGSSTARRSSEASRIRSALATLNALAKGTRLIWAHSPGGSHPVFVGSGILSGPGGFALLRADVTLAKEPMRPLPLNGRRFLVTDENVVAVVDAIRRRSALAPLEQAAAGANESAGEQASGADRVQVIPPGETAKTLEQLGALVAQMADDGFTRADHVAALGGGVVGDLAGFCAAVYQRGVPVIQLPTTVVAQVDSAYGGKTGVDLPAAKNYVGAYHLPAAVVTDPALLTRLPAAELASGFVEALKTGLLAGGRLWRAVREVEPGSAPALAEHPFLIFDCANFKCGVVAADERDGGLRQILNFGHTVGHAIETAGRYRAYRHGEAVGLGLLAALRLSGADRLHEEVKAILAAWRLPVQVERQPDFPDLTPANVVALTRRDKKRMGDRTPFVLLSEPGAPRFGQTVSDSDLLVAVEELFA